jgi:hypothetical protein
MKIQRANLLLFCIAGLRTDVLVLAPGAGALAAIAPRAPRGRGRQSRQAAVISGMTAARGV